MDKKTKYIIGASAAAAIALSISTAYYLAYQLVENKVAQDQRQKHTTKAFAHQTTNEITIAAWNIQAFGTRKAAQQQLVQAYAAVITNADVTVIQEIKDRTQTAIYAISQHTPGFQLIVSSRAGSTASKEQYAVFVNTNKLAITDMVDYNTKQLQTAFERPPLRIEMTAGTNYGFTLYTIHTKPTAVQPELQGLERIIDAKDLTNNTVIIGDLNASGSYYNRGEAEEFRTWSWQIPDFEDTTTKSTVCAYDRAILNSNMNREFKNYGIIHEINGTKITPAFSDHYPIFIHVKTKDQ